MEKRKLLLVAISAGLFLVISIGAAIMVFSPQTTSLPAVTEAYRSESPTGISVNPQNNQDTASPYINNGVTLPGSTAFDPIEVVRGNAEFPGLQEGNVLQESSFHVSGADQAVPETERQINVPRPTSAAVPATPPVGRAAPQTVTAPSQAPASTQPAIPAPVNSPRPAAATAAPAASTPAAREPAAVEPRAATSTSPTASSAPAAQSAQSATSTVTANPAPASTTTQPSAPATVQANQRDDFWVQTGSFSTIARAELVKENLSTRGITSLIENRDIDGRTFYRVRVGPYTSYNEASYWLSLIQSIDGFQDSQIWQTPARR